jgi:hypothetical protein
MTVHQMAHFSNQPMLSHEKAIMHIGWYLLDTCSHGIFTNLTQQKDSSATSMLTLPVDRAMLMWTMPKNVLSHTGYIITYAGCPLHWVSCLQIEIALSTAEAEYIAISQPLRDVLPLISLLEELHNIFPLKVIPPNFICKVHEDNPSCISMATLHKYSPQTKHIGLKYHHFCQHIKSGRILTSYCQTTEEKADILTKPLSDDLFFKLW